MTKFQEAIFSVVQLVPQGKVISYSQIAAYIGTPRAARQVGWAMRSMEGWPGLAWWRVVNNFGQITIKGNRFNDAGLQCELLVADGISLKNDQVDMSIYRFRPDSDELQELKLDTEYKRIVLAKYDID